MNRVTTSFVSVDFEKIGHTVAQRLDVQIEGQLLLYFNYFYHIPSVKRYPEQGITKWVTAKNDRLRK